MSKLRISSLGFAAALIGLLLTSCSMSGIEGSRHQLYDSIDALAADSSLIIVGSVQAQQTVRGDIPFTTSKISITQTLSTQTLGDNIDHGLETVAPGATVTVRQIGEVGFESIPAPILDKASTYLLFLTPTMLPETEGGDEFFVTGGSAGIYQFDGSAYLRVDAESGDNLPRQLTLTDFR